MKRHNFVITDVIECSLPFNSTKECLVTATIPFYALNVLTV